ncbi:MAG: response regulator [Candidatus Dadabacteria bacterium]|nr:MAG: response regulator [Candidatus Dadabacteria bacterium]
MTQGTIAGKYKILEKIGAGGTGTVYKVLHLDLGVEYALKVLNRELSLDSTFIDQFKQEAEALRQFSHPNTPQLRDFGRTGEGDYYITMDLGEGRNLSDIIAEDGPSPVSLSLEIIIQVLDVVQAAHNFGIVHRDIKSSNVLIREDVYGRPERVLLLDFGTALLREHLERKEVSKKGEESCIGTPAYMSPEQAAGEHIIDWRSDIYSCGVVLYEILTGRLPFEGEDLVETLVMQVMKPAPPLSSAGEFPEYLERIVRKALEKKPGDRYQSAEEFKQDCIEVLKRISAVSSKDLSKVIRRDTLVSNNLSGSYKSLSPVESKLDLVNRGEERVKVLCIDDDLSILNILEYILNNAGYQTFITADFSSVHNFIFGEGVNLLIADVNMPGLSGVKICKLLKRSMPELKIVLFSNINERELEAAARESGADGWISKFSKPSDWLEAIQRIVSSV